MNDHARDPERAAHGDDRRGVDRRSLAREHPRQDTRPMCSRRACNPRRGRPRWRRRPCRGLGRRRAALRAPSPPSARAPPRRHRCGGDRHRSARDAPRGPSARSTADNRTARVRGWRAGGDDGDDKRESRRGAAYYELRQVCRDRVVGARASSSRFAGFGAGIFVMGCDREREPAVHAEVRALIGQTGACCSFSGNTPAAGTSTVMAIMLCVAAVLRRRRAR